MRQYRGPRSYYVDIVLIVSFPPSFVSSAISSIRLPCRRCASSAAPLRCVKRSAFAVALVMHQGSYGRRTAKCQGSLYRNAKQRLDGTAQSRCIFRASIALNTAGECIPVVSVLGFAAYLLLLPPRILGCKGLHANTHIHKLLRH